MVVALRVGNATSSVILKGSDLHRFLAFSNLGMAIGNLILSVLLVRIYGLIGVAIGTLIPMFVLAAFVTFPAACRRVELPVWKVAWKAVWPAVWPAIVMGGFILLRRDKLLGDRSWLTLMLHAFMAAAIYAVLFLIAMDRKELDWYFKKVKELFRRRPVTSASTDLGLPS
jgi:O-antigen/teichoic acid export membrane protein